MCLPAPTSILVPSQFWTTASNWRSLHKSWMHDSWEKLHGETVEREVTNAYKVLFKTAKVFGQRGGLDKCAENCELIREEVEAFKKFVPLVQVRAGGRRFTMPFVCYALLAFPVHACGWLVVVLGYCAWPTRVLAVHRRCATPACGTGTGTSCRRC